VEENKWETMSPNPGTVVSVRGSVIGEELVDVVCGFQALRSPPFALTRGPGRLGFP
jgi:hypothetical protein